jgi:uncharacterized Zn-binding protein involved in type VI secretion
MPVKAGLLGDPVDHFDGHVGEVISSCNYVYDNGILVARVDDLVHGHKGTAHATTSCKITVGSSVLHIDGKPVSYLGSEVSCDGLVRAQAIVLYVDP